MQLISLKSVNNCKKVWYYINYIYLCVELMCKVMNTTKIKITGYNGDMPIKIVLQKFCLLRYCEKIGDTEIVNNYQLGRLKYQNVEFEKITNN